MLAPKHYTRNFQKLLQQLMDINPTQKRYLVTRINGITHNRIPTTHSSLLLPSLTKRTYFFGSKSKASDDTAGDSTLHTYLLKEGNKNLEQSALQSVNDFDQAIETQETSEAYSKRAFAYFYIKDYTQAGKDAQSAISLNPRSIEGYIAAASVEVALENHKEALRYLSEAIDLTSPLDFRRTAVQEVINGCKLALQVESTATKPTDKTDTASAASAAAAATDQSSKSTTPPIEKTETAAAGQNVMEAMKTTTTTADAEVVSHTTDDGLGDDDPLKTEAQNTAAQQMVDVPFDNPDFMDLQKDITQQMVDIGGLDFQAKLQKLNEIPAVQRFQSKALKGEKPTYDDYMALMKDDKFRKYNEVMTEIAKNPKFATVTQKFAAMDWVGAYEELKKDPEALKLYMKAFDELE